MKKFFIEILLLSLLFINAYTQPPPGYYDNAAGFSGNPLKTALHNIIKNHTVINYSDLWTAFQTTDDKPNGKVWDIYSDVPGGTPPYEYTFISDQCGGYSTEGDCYNREHSFPVSWFGDTSPMNSDLFQIYPTDGYVNNKRGNLPYGNVGTSSWTSLNGSKTGTCNNPGYFGTVFEPIDEYKGDLARTYFYMAVRYYTEDSGWPGSDMVTGAEPKTWAINMLLNWHSDDTVSEKEMNRNNAIYTIQNNRNPFIDHPDWVLSIWGPTAGIEKIKESLQIKTFPNPVTEYFSISCNCNIMFDKIEIYNTTGMLIKELINTNGNYINVSGLDAGVYTVKASLPSANAVTKIIIIPKN